MYDCATHDVPSAAFAPEETSGLEPARTAELRTVTGTFIIQERRLAPRSHNDQSPAPSTSYAGSPQMMGLGGLIIIGVLIASYTSKYDLAIGHKNGILAVPAIGYLALQLFLARAAFRLFDDVRSFKSVLDFAVNRAFRYLPAVVPSVLLGFVITKTVTLPGMHADLGTLPANLLMMADFAGVTDVDSSHWRLKIEIIQAALVAAAWFGPARRHLAALMTVALAMNAISIDGEPVRQHVFSLHGLMTNDGYLPLFVFGIALHQLTQDRGSPVWRTMLLTSAELAFLSNTPLHGAFVVAALVVLASIAFGKMSGLGRWRWLCHLGEIAFPIYVAHYVLGFAVIHHLEASGCPPVLAIVCASAAAICIGKLLNSHVERPLQQRMLATTQAVNAAVEYLLTAPRVLRAHGLLARIS